MRLHLRADDGIRTRDPHLGKVMRYQLRYIRAPRTRSSPVAKDDDSPQQRSHTNPFNDTLSRAPRRRSARDHLPRGLPDWWVEPRSSARGDGKVSRCARGHYETCEQHHQRESTRFVLHVG
jgi:hypothetical protein